MEDLKKVCSKKLKALASGVSVQDKLDAMKLFDLSRPTVDKYLAGDCVKIDTATKLLQFFESRVNNVKNLLNVA